MVNVGGFAVSFHPVVEVVCKGFDVLGAARFPGAAEGGIAFAKEVRDLQLPHGGNAIEHWVIVVPLLSDVRIGRTWKG